MNIGYRKIPPPPSAIMAGLALFPPKSAQGPGTSTKGLSSICPCFIVLNLSMYVMPLHPHTVTVTVQNVCMLHHAPGKFNLRPELLYTKKSVFWPPQKGFGFDGTALYTLHKNLVKIPKPNFFRLKIQEPFFFFLCLMTMGMVTAIALFWPNKPNPAILLIQYTGAPPRALVNIYISDLDGVCTPQLFYTCFYKHARRLRLEKLLCLEPSRTSNGFF
jgi:hypothetical protein